MAEVKKQNALITIVQNEKAKAWASRALYLPEAKRKDGAELYFQRVLMMVKESEQLVKISQTPAGAQSIFLCIWKALQMGLQIGGQIPHAYIVGYGEKATLIPTADGYKFIALSDPATLKNFQARPVYDGENFRLNYVTGEVLHEYDGKTPRGHMLGVYGVITELDGSTRAEYMSIADIHAIRDRRSSAWKAYQDGKIKEDRCPWATDHDMLAIKTAIKRFLKPYAALKEGLAMAVALDEDVADNGPTGTVIDMPTGEPEKPTEATLEEPPKKELF
jgi:phage RecT family recombinase